MGVVDILLPPMFCYIDAPKALSERECQQTVIDVFVFLKMQRSGKG